MEKILKFSGYTLCMDFIFLAYFRQSDLLVLKMCQ